ncbi:MAG: NifU family protein [Halobacteriovoraceae bacterium]|nr:NifU family protein [Halobacteriovoraceae bacterium]MCB9095950.1 NifU family protein [Halobacteriovoraceae bacterium]
MIHQIEKLFDKQVRPALAEHGGGVEIVDVDNNKLFLILKGGCHGCSSSKATLKGGIEKIVQKHFPEIEEVVDLTDHTSGENPYM